MSDITASTAISTPQVGDDRCVPTAAPRMVLWEKLGWAFMAGLMIVGLPLAYQRAVDRGPDLAGFCDAGTYILQHGTRDPESTLARYWPSADVPWIVFSLLPISVTVVVWYGLNCAAWYGLLHTICHRLLTGPDKTALRHATLAAGLLATPLVLDGMALGSFHVPMVWLMALGLDRACRGRQTSGGILLGTAAWLKLLPMLGIAFLLYHRKWKAAAVELVTVATLEIVLSLAAFGPAGAWREHVLWWQAGAKGTADRQLTSADPEDEDRLTNQSVAVTLRRLCTSLGTTVETPAAGPVTDAAGAKRELTADGRTRRHVQLLELSPGQLKTLFLAVMGLLMLAVAIYCRPVSPAAWAEKGPAKIVMLVLATLWFSPVAWSYHFVAATPAVATLLLRARYRWAWVLPVVVVWCAALCLLASDRFRVAGVLLWMSLIIGAGLVVYRAKGDTGVYESRT